MAISVVVVIEPAGEVPVGDDLVARIAQRTRTLVIGDGKEDAEQSADMGPLITGEHRDRESGFIEAGESAGATLVVDGRTVEVSGDRGGFWLGPTLFDNVTADMEICRQEIFGPVLCVARVSSCEEAVALVNANPYGNGTAIFTNDGGTARRFETEIEVGMVGINVP